MSEVSLIPITDKKYQNGAVLAFVLILLCLVASTILFLMTWMQTESRTNHAYYQQQIALTVAETGMNQTLQYLAEFKSQFAEEKFPWEELTNKVSNPTNHWDWIINDNRYTNFGFCTNTNAIILAQPIFLEDETSFFIAALSTNNSHYDIHTLGGVLPLKGTNPITRYIATRIFPETLFSTNILRAGLIASNQFEIKGNVSITSTNSSTNEIKEASLKKAITDKTILLSLNPTNCDSVEGSNVIQGYYITASPTVYSGDGIIRIGNNIANFTNEVKKTNSQDYKLLSCDANHILTRSYGGIFDPLESPTLESCAEVPIVDVGPTNAIVKTLVISTSGNWKITGADLYPITLETDVVANLVLPNEYTIAEKAVTMVGNAQLTIFPQTNLTLGTPAFATVKKDCSVLKIWGSTNSEQAITVQGNPQESLWAKIYAPYSDITIKENICFGGLLVGKKVVLENNVNLIIDEAAWIPPLFSKEQVISTNTNCVRFLVEDWKQYKE